MIKIVVGVIVLCIISIYIVFNQNFFSSERLIDKSEVSPNVAETQQSGIANLSEKVQPKLQGSISNSFILNANAFEILAIDYHPKEDSDKKNFLGKTVIGSCKINNKQTRLSIIKSLKIFFKEQDGASGCASKKGYGIRIISNRKVLNLLFTFYPCRAHGFEYDEGNPNLLLRKGETEISYDGKKIFEKELKKCGIQPFKD